MPNPGQQLNLVKRSVQEQANRSYDEVYDVDVTELVGEDTQTVPNQLLRFQLTPGGLLKIASVPGAGKTLLYAKIDQGGVGTTSLVSAPGAGLRIKVIHMKLTLSIDGTVKFTSGGTDLTGAMDIAGKGGFVENGSVQEPVLESDVNSALSIVTTGGMAKGNLVYFIE